ncbi:MAG: GGDEF domain-containing protein [Desulfovibrio sp.]
MSDSGLKYSNDTALQILNNLPDVAFVYDESGTYVDILGKRTLAKQKHVKKLLEKNISDILPKEVATLFQKHISAILASDKTTEDSIIKFEYALDPQEVTGMVMANGIGVQWFEARLSKIPALIDGKQLIICLTQNITKSKATLEKFQQNAHTDSLTGASNRRGFTTFAKETLVASKNAGRRASMLMLDLDHFKHINDTYGHPVGDMVLVHFADLCKQSIRESDIFSRIGGEEFTILLPDTEPDVAMLIAARIRLKVESTPLLNNSETIPFTVSIGVSCQQSDELDVDAMLSRADQALYMAKENGRNKVEAVL